jgi:ATP-dependent RNA helicase DDX18/HAS1
MSENARLFSDLPIDARLSANLASLHLRELFPIQRDAIPPLLAGRDVLAAAKTGSGKTLAFLVPAAQRLLSLDAQPEGGVQVLIVAPSRELALQIADVAAALLAGTGVRSGTAIGGTPKKADAELFSRGVSLLVATPGRLVDHILSTPTFTLKFVKIFVMDEADRILEAGFRLQLDEIIANLPADRQTALFSATQTRDVDALAAVSFRQESPLYIGVDDQSESSTAAGLTQAYVVTPPEKRLMLLITFLKKQKGKKVMVFFSTKASVKFHHKLFKDLKIVSLAIHGDQSQEKRTKAFNAFRGQTAGLLLCTDVAARGLDIPAVEWIVQFDPPASEKEYIHRVGRSARAGAEGRALLFLMANEMPFLRHLEEARVPLKELKFPEDKVMKLDLLIANILNTKRDILALAKEALKAYLMAYESHSLKDSFNVEHLAIEGVAQAFGFDELPHLNIPLSDGRKQDGAWIKKEKRKQRR